MHGVCRRSRQQYLSGPTVGEWLHCSLPWFITRRHEVAQSFSVGEPAHDFLICDPIRWRLNAEFLNNIGAIGQKELWRAERRGERLGAPPHFAEAYLLEDVTVMEFRIFEGGR